MYSNRSILRGERACGVFYLTAIVSFILFVFMLSIIIFHPYIDGNQWFKFIVQILGAVLGAIGAISGFIIVIGMLVYLCKYDKVRIIGKVAWVLCFLTTGSAGASAYFFLCYRRRECQRIYAESDSPRTVEMPSLQNLPGILTQRVEASKDYEQLQTQISFLQGRHAVSIFKVCASISLAVGMLFGICLPIYDLVLAEFPYLASWTMFLGACLGVAWAVASTVMLAGMLVYLIRYENAPLAHRTAWLLCFVLFAWIGPSIYFFKTYRNLSLTRNS